MLTIAQWVPIPKRPISRTSHHANVSFSYHFRGHLTSLQTPENHKVDRLFSRYQISLSLVDIPHLHSFVCLRMSISKPRRYQNRTSKPHLPIPLVLHDIQTLPVPIGSGTISDSSYTPTSASGPHPPVYKSPFLHHTSHLLFSLLLQADTTRGLAVSTSRV